MIKKAYRQYFRIQRRFSTSSSDPWETLGLKERYSKEELKEAYVRLVKEYHPDKNPDNLVKFMEIQASYKALKDGITIKPTGKDGENDAKSQFRQQNKERVKKAYV